MAVSNPDKKSKPAALYLSDNSKTKFTSTHHNTFGLMYGLPENGGTCPGATLGKGGCLDVRDGHKRSTCYMAKITQIYKAVGVKLTENTELLKGKSYTEMVEILRATVQNFVDKNEESAWFFRLHYSGDFFSPEYTKAWATVIGEFPKVKFWVYTRSHDLVHYLIDCTNLTLFLSVDPVNWESGRKVFEQFKERPNIGLAWLGGETPAEFRWVTCPETSGVINNTKEQGACAKCRLCIDRYKSKVRNINFVLH
jgi:hypothetical protein